MRKISFFSGIILLLAVLYSITVLIIGIYFQKRYYDFVNFYNLQGNYRIYLTDYRRGWFTSDILLQVNIIHPETINLLTVLGINKSILPKNYLIKQHVIHGPFTLSPLFFGFAAIKYKMIPTHEIKQLFSLPIDFSDPILQGTHLVKFNGVFFTSVHCPSLNATKLNAERKVSFDKLNINFWVWPYPNEPHVSGNLSVDNILFTDKGLTISKPNLKMDFNQNKQGSDWYFNITL